MPRRKKYPKLPNGFGSIRYLGKNRRNPYAVHPHAAEVNEIGRPITPPAICYVDSWVKGFAVLTAYNAGTYKPGMENEMNNLGDVGSANMDEITGRLLADFNRIKQIEEKPEEKTFEQVYKEFYEYKFEKNKKRNYSNSTKNTNNAAFKNCAVLHNRIFSSLRHEDLQAVLDQCKLKHSSIELIVTLLHQMYAYAEMMEIVEKDYSAHISINIPDDDESGVPFSENELSILWENKEEPVVEFILIMCYSGYRIKAYETMEVNLEQKYFKGGIKNAASKDRIVPIHSAIFPLVQRRMKKYGRIMTENNFQYRKVMYPALNRLGIPKHTPHDCRHTFSMLCEKYGVKENDRKRMLGHSFGNDITNRIYGHREIEELRKEIEKIKV